MYNSIMCTQVLLVGRGLFQDGLARMLETHRNAVAVIGSAESWQRAKQLLRQLQPDTLVADYQYIDTIIADIEKLSIENEKIDKVLFISLDENKMVVYRRQLITDITINQLVEAL